MPRPAPIRFMTHGMWFIAIHERGVWDIYSSKRSGIALTYLGSVFMDIPTNWYKGNKWGATTSGDILFPTMRDAARYVAMHPEKSSYVGGLRR